MGIRNDFVDGIVVEVEDTEGVRKSSVFERGPSLIRSPTLDFSEIIEEIASQFKKIPLNASPDDVEVTFGLKASSKGKMYISKGTNDANLIVKVRWSNR